MARPLFITFEGGEGAGKTTQIRRLIGRLPQAVMTREPGGTPAAEALRNLFIAHHGQDWPLSAQLLLMFTARALHTEKFIKPSLAEGKTVLCDRYTDSSRVYQGYAGGMDLDAVERIKQFSIGDFEPDITFILDIDPAIGLKRASVRYTADDTFEAKDIAFHERLRQGFLAIAKESPGRCVVIDASADEETIAEKIWAAVKEKSDV